MAPDEVTWRWLSGTLKTDARRGLMKTGLVSFAGARYFPTTGANYAVHHHIDMSEIEPMVSCPHSVDNVQPLSAVAARGRSM